MFVVVPHITDAIQEWVERVAKVPVDGETSEPDVCIIEVKNNFTVRLCTICFYYFVLPDDTIVAFKRWAMVGVLCSLVLGVTSCKIMFLGALPIFLLRH